MLVRDSNRRCFSTQSFSFSPLNPNKISVLLFLLYLRPFYAPLSTQHIFLTVLLSHHPPFVINYCVLELTELLLALGLSAFSIVYLFLFTYISPSMRRWLGWFRLNSTSEGESWVRVLDGSVGSCLESVDIFMRHFSVSFFSSCRF